MAYKKSMDGYILTIGTGSGGTEITDAEYKQIMAVIQAKPARTETTDYRLREDLTWEPYTIEEPEPADEDVTADEIMAALEEIL